MLSLPLALLLSTSAAVGDNVTLTLDIQKGGDLRWKKDAPCEADVIAKDRSVTHADNVATGILVPPGPVDVVVACLAQEGTLRKTVRLNATRDQTVKVTFAPGFLTTAIEREGKLSVGDVVVYDAFDHEIARGKDRTVLPVDAGNVRVVVVVDKATAAATRDIRGEQRATVKAAQKTELKIDASDGEILVTVVENGRAAKALVALREPGSNNRVVEITPGTATSVPSGTWDLVSQLEDAHDFREQLTKGVVVNGKKTTTKQLSHTTGKLVPVVTPAEGVVVDLLLPGAEKAFNQIEPNTEARLTPGKYVVRATRDVTLDDGSKPVVLQTVNIGGGSTSRVTLNPAVAHVDVEVRVGGEPRPLQVGLSLLGAAAPLVSRPADAAGKAGFDVSPQTVIVSTTLPTAHGPLDVKKQLVLKAGVNRARLDIDVGHVVIQVIDGGAAVAGEVAFFQRLKSGQPDGVPVVVVKAGEEAFLPPGIYVLAVKRKGEQRLFGELKLASGRLVERALDWSPPAPPEAKVEPKKDEPKKDDAKSAKKEEPKKEEPKPPTTTKEEPKAASPKEAPKEAPKDEPKKEVPKEEPKKKKADPKKPPATPDDPEQKKAAVPAVP
ncbi:MAG: hypothetical protein Q8O67_12190 [Deltaproteobacteria bacterium]|nr:hypothetical protein [Deltaproteobacteria bacterium]